MICLLKAKQCDAQSGFSAPAFCWSTIFSGKTVFSLQITPKGGLFPDHATDRKYSARPAI
jgi:hypothetical protein